MFQSWNVIPFSKVKTTCARLLDADQFTWSQLRFLNESSKDHIWILCAKKNFAQQKGKTTWNFCILGFELQNATQQLSLRQQCLNVVGLRVSFWSAPHWAVHATLGFKSSIYYKDYKSHSWWCCCCSFAANVVLVGFCFSLRISYTICVFFLNPQVFGMEKVAPNWWLLLRALGSKRWPNNRLDHITAALGQLLWIFHCLRIDFQCDVD